MFHLAIKYSKSIVSGGLAGGVHVLGLFLLHEYGGLHYLVSSCVAFIFAILVNYSLQKMWVFESRTTERANVEFFQFVIATGVYLALNTLLLYTCVYFLKIHYLVSQVCITLLLSILNFYMYGRIFRKNQSI